jgi:hypothetical protein
VRTNTRPLQLSLDETLALQSAYEDAHANPAGRPVEAARKWLLESGSVSDVLQIPFYEYFFGYASFQSANPLTAQAEIEALYSEFVFWDFSPSILQALLSVVNVSL